MTLPDMGGPESSISWPRTFGKARWIWITFDEAPKSPALTPVTMRSVASRTVGIAIQRDARPGAVAAGGVWELHVGPLPVRGCDGFSAGDHGREPGPGEAHGLTTRHARVARGAAVC